MIPLKFTIVYYENDFCSKLYPWNGSVSFIIVMKQSFKSVYVLLSLLNVF